MAQAAPGEGTYFVDQSGQYYYQASGDQQPVMTVVTGELDLRCGSGHAEEGFGIRTDEPNKLITSISLNVRLSACHEGKKI